MSTAVALEQVMRIKVPEGCERPHASFGTDDVAVLDRLAAEVPGASLNPGKWVTWVEDGVSVQVSYTPGPGVAASQGEDSR